MTPEPLSPAVLEWVREALGPRQTVQSVERLNGSTSTDLFNIQADQVAYVLRTEYVLRLYTNTQWLAEEPDVPRHEAANLARLQPAGLPVPELVAVDPDGAQCGIPALLMTRVSGAVTLTPPNLDDWLREMAEFLPRLHAVSPAGHRWNYAPYNDLSSLRVPEWSRRKELWERVIAIANQPWPAFPAHFIHRDFHPVNVLFQADRLSGVVDWPNACVGPVGIDVAWCRHNLAAMYGPETADRFLVHCQTVMSDYWTYDPFWDLMTIIELLPGPPDVYPPWIEFGLQGMTDAIMLDRHERYLASLLDRYDQRE